MWAFLLGGVCRLRRASDLHDAARCALCALRLNEMAKPWEPGLP